MQKLFRKYMLYIMVLAGIIILTGNFALLTMSMRRDMVHAGLNDLTQLSQIISANEEAMSGVLNGQNGEEITYIFSLLPHEYGQIYFAADKETGEILFHTKDSFYGQSLYDFGISSKKLLSYQRGKYISFDDDDTYYCVMKEFNGILLGTGKKASVLYEGRRDRMVWTFVFILLIDVLLLYLINELIKEKVVREIDTLVTAMGKLDQESQGSVQLVQGIPEFEKLSVAINRTLRDLLNATGRLSRAIELVHIPIAAYEYYGDMNRVMATKRLGAILGLDKRTAADLYVDREAFVAKIQDIQKDPEPEEDHIYRMQKRGRTCWLRMISVQDSDVVLGMVMDVSRDMRAKHSIRQERDLDPLTGIYNRRSFEKKAQEVLSMSDIGMVGMAMLDLDYFKEVNDNYGHEFGDLYLKMMSSYLRRIADDRTCVGRRSGDEFYLFFHHYDDGKPMEETLWELHHMLEEEPVNYPDGKVEPMGVSAGLFYHSADEHLDFAELLAAADKKLYEAKQKGRGCFVCGDE